MAKLRIVPGWVRSPPGAVSYVEDFLLRLYGRTESPEALAGYSALAWLGGADGVATAGPLVWRAPAEERFAEAFLAVADALAEGEPYPAPNWWRQQAASVAPMTVAQWRDRAESLPERFYAHGVACALGWVLGVFDDPAIMAPLHCGDGSSVTYAEREEWRVRLRGFAIPPHLAGEAITAWLTAGPGPLVQQRGR